MSTRNIVHIFSGTQGSGKTTLINKLVARNRKSNPEITSLICSADHFFCKSGVYRIILRQLPLAHKECRQKYANGLEAGIPHIYVDNTNVEEKHVLPYVELAERYGYTIKIFTVSCDPRIAFKRNVHNVPQRVINQTQEKFNAILPFFSEGEKQGRWELTHLLT
ncbi:MAG: hypothetical protein CL685_00220 [Candidatus Magasanikbacteria bacterium]|nr:hypothetical protein [Candidatus Magasanikbacteria bacterium]|tara:strand:- start:1972 stop:2463 length:492 start_codon:yes stop_codon:yes gene_type:complete